MNKLKLFPMLESNDRITFFAYIVSDKFVNDFKTPDEKYQLCGTTNLSYALYEMLRYAEFHGIPEQEVIEALIHLTETTDYIDHELLQEVIIEYADLWGDRKEWRQGL